MVESLFQDRTASWVRIVNEIEKYVTESTETIEDEEHRASGRLVAKARPRLKPAVTLYSASVPLRERKCIDINPEKYHHDCFVVSKAMIRLLRHHQSVTLEDDGAVVFDDILEEFKKKKFLLQWPMNNWISILANGGGPKKRFQYCLNPNSSRHFLHFRPIQGHWGGNYWSWVARQCTVTRRIYWVHLPRRVCKWNAFNNQKWIDSGRKKASKEEDKRYSSQIRVNPMEDDQNMEEIRCNLDKPRLAPYKNTWTPLQNTVHWCNLKLAQKRGLQFYQTRSHAIVLYNTLSTVCIEKAVCMKTQEELYHKICLTPRLPRVVLKANLHSGQQGQREQDARTSCDQPSESKSSWETWNNTVDYRILGIPFSTVEQQDTNREDKVKKLIEQFESQPHKESFLQDVSQTQKINKFSEKSKDLIADMSNTKIFELCETSSKKQCTDCNLYWEIGIVYCTCGRCLKSSQRIKGFDKSNYDVSSIPGYVI